MTSPGELQSLFASAQAGDREAFRVLYGILAPRVFRFVRPRAKSRADALDVLQDVFIDFWKGLPRFTYQGDAALNALFYRIASRKLSRTFLLWGRTVSLETLDDIVIEESSTNREDALDVARAMQGLSAKDQEILTLRYVEGKPFSDISQLLEQSENALKVRCHRAIGRLRNKLHYES